MKSKIIVGNQKMLMEYKDVKNFVDNFKYKKDVIIIPSDIYVSYYLENGYNVGIQNISKYELGSYTGSVSALQAKSMKIKYALVGHSELNENPHIINLKIKQCIKNDIKVILCVSETIKNKNSVNELKNQILDLLEEICEDDIIREERDMDLFEEDILDSLGFAELLTRIEEETGVIISPSEVVRDDINTVNKILELVKSKKQG